MYAKRTGAAAGRRPMLQAIRATPIVIKGEESAAPSRVRSAATPAVEARRSMVQVHQGEACNPVASAASGPPAREAGKEMEEVVAAAAAAAAALAAAAAAAGRGLRRWRRWWWRGWMLIGVRCRRGEEARPVKARGGVGGAQAEAAMTVVISRIMKKAAPPT